MGDVEFKGFRLLNWPSLLAFVLLSWGVLLLPPRMRSLRPSSEGIGGAAEARGNLYETRLWQDPFDVLTDARRRKDSLPPLAGSIDSTAKPGETTLILAVFLTGGDFPEEIETRLRARYAVVSALGVSGYVPDYSGRLSCGASPWGGATEVFPNEVYRLAAPTSDPSFGRVDLHGLTGITDPGRSPHRVVVIWMDEGLFDNQRPASLLASWVRTLQSPNRKVAILGPQESGTLLGFLREPKPAPPEPELSPRVGIYSFCSTVASLREPAPPSPVSPPPSDTLRSRGFDLVHVIGTDRELADALRDELALRGVDSTKRIALVAEWDTFYSESMFDVFDNVFSSPRFFTYQRGIDGRLPKDPAAAGGSASSGASSVLPGGEPLVRGPATTSFGRSQIDYLPRLVGQMKASGGANWAAIGVLGSDFYDKVLIIETLKHEFPGALFFTTDLDQRYLDSAVHPTTRNLLIASHYGLALHEDLQRAIPPFRGVYQTALFLGCLKALRGHGVPAPQPPSPPTASWLDWARGKDPIADALPDPLKIAWTNGSSKSDAIKPRPMVFEVSQSQAQPLTDPGPENVHPRAFAQARDVDATAMLVLMFLSLVGGVWLLSMWSSLRTLAKKYWWFTALVAVAAVCMLLIVLIDHRRYDGEPFTIFQGVSTWPTTLLRLTAALFCVAALAHAQILDLENLRTLSDSYGLPGDAQSANKNGIACLSLDAGTTDPRTVWGRYHWLNLPRQRSARVFLQVLLYLALVFVLAIWLGTPREPYRGRLNFWTNRTVLIVAVLTAVSLLWFVIDANRICIRMIHLFDDNLIDWPEQTRERVAVSSGVDRSFFLRCDLPDLKDAVERSLRRMASLFVMADRSAVVEPMMYSVALAFLLLFLARSPFFDQFVMSPILIVVFSVALLGVFCCGAWLRHTMGRARGNAVGGFKADLHALRTALLAAPANESLKKGVDAIEKLAQAAGELRTGALSPLGENPILHTVLLLLGGIGALFSIEPIRDLLF